MFKESDKSHRFKFLLINDLPKVSTLKPEADGLNCFFLPQSCIKPCPLSRAPNENQRTLYDLVLDLYFGSYALVLDGSHLGHFRSYHITRQLTEAEASRALLLT